MKLSVVIITKNRAEMLAKSLHALENQMTYGDEIIVIDDGSKDPTKEVVNTFPKKIRYVLNKNSGISNARNLGIKKSKNEIIAFIDDDCIAHKTWIKTIKKGFSVNNNIDVMGGKTLPLEPFNLVIRAGQFLREYHKDVKRVSKHYFLSSALTENLAFRKKVFKKVGFFDTRIAPTGEDSEFCFRLRKFGVKILFNPAMLVYHKHRNTLKGFLAQYFFYGQGVVKIKRVWPDFPSKLPDSMLNTILFSLGFFVMPLLKIFRIKKISDLVLFPFMILGEFAFRIGIIAGMYE